MSRGANETNLLKENVRIILYTVYHSITVIAASNQSYCLQIEDQLKRLLTQLEDVESMKEELDEDEYQNTRKVSIILIHLYIAHVS
ncbi:hypothetical protein EON65_34675 [archaeon]|nr:MAG: hypothetical protein EON65_34675 [archaeon]